MQTLIITSGSEIVKVARETYDAIKEGGSMRILGYLMHQVISLLSHFRKINYVMLTLASVNIRFPDPPIYTPIYMHRLRD